MSNTVINTNVLSINAQRNLSKSAGMMAQSLERLSSGLRINSAKDDAAGLAIATRFTAQINGSMQAMRNTNDGLSITQTAEGSMNTIMDNLQTMRQLAVQSSSDGNNALDRQALNNDLQALLSEVKRIAATTEFNGTRLLDGTTFGQVFQIGANQGQTIEMNGVDARATQIGASRVVGSQGLSADNIKAGFEVKGKIDIGVSQSRGVALNDSLVLEIDLDKLGGFNDGSKYNSVEISGLNSAAIRAMGSETSSGNWGGIDLVINGNQFNVQQAFADTSYSGWQDISSGEQLADFLNQAVTARPDSYGVQAQWDSATSTWSSDSEHPQFATWESSGSSGKLVLQTDPNVTLSSASGNVFTDNDISAFKSVGVASTERLQTELTGTNSSSYSQITIDGVDGLTYAGGGGNFAVDYKFIRGDEAPANLSITYASGETWANAADAIVDRLNAASTADNRDLFFQRDGNNLIVRDLQGRGFNALPAETKVIVDATNTTATSGLVQTEAVVNGFIGSSTFAAGTYDSISFELGGETITAQLQGATKLPGLAADTDSIQGLIRTAVAAHGNYTDDNKIDVVRDGDTLRITDQLGRSISNVVLTKTHAEPDANVVTIKLTDKEAASVTGFELQLKDDSTYVSVATPDPTAAKGMYDAFANVSNGQELATALNAVTFAGGATTYKLEASWNTETNELTVKAFNQTATPDKYVNIVSADFLRTGTALGKVEETKAGTGVNSLEDLTRVVNSAIDAAVKGTEPEGFGLKTASGEAATAAQRQEFGLANLKAGIVTLQNGSSTITVTGAFDAKFDLDMTDFRAVVNDKNQTEVHFFGEGDANVLTSKQVSLNEINVSTREDASLAVSIIDGALAMISDKRSEIGATQRKFESALENLGVARQNMEASRSRIVDTDFAVETANLTKAQILQQAGISVLAQANASSQSVLSLLQ